MISFVYEIIKEGIIDNNSSIKILNNDTFNQIRIIVKQFPILIYNEINDKIYNKKILSFDINNITFIINDIYTIILTNKNDIKYKINVKNIQIDIKTKNILNSVDEINIHYEHINDEPIILLEIIELLCYKIFTINNKLKYYINSNIETIKENFQYKMIHKINNVFLIINNIQQKSHYFNFIELITVEYSNIYEIIFGIKFNKDLFNILKPSNVKTLFLFILIDKEKLFEKQNIRNNEILNIRDDLGNNYDNFIIENNYVNSDEDEESDEKIINIIDKLEKINDIKKIKLEMIQLEYYIKSYCFDNNDFYFIKTSYNILKILTINNIELTLKIGYVIKNFLNDDIETIKYIINLYNLLYDNEKIDDNIYLIIQEKKLIHFLSTKNLEIPKIVFNFKNKIDIIDIYDFQDCFVLLCEDTYINNKINYNEIFENYIKKIKYSRDNDNYKNDYYVEKEKYKKLKEIYDFIKKNKKKL
jgi:hypothetical protein